MRFWQAAQLRLGWVSGWGGLWHGLGGSYAVGYLHRVEGLREAPQDGFWCFCAPLDEFCGPRTRRAVGLGIAYRLLRRSKGVGPRGPPRDTYKRRRKSPIIEVSGGISYVFWTSRDRPRRPFRTTGLSKCNLRIVFSNIRVMEQLPPHCSREDERNPTRCTAEWFLHRGCRQTRLGCI